MLPRISVVIPTFDRCEVVRVGLCALARQTLAPSEYEVIVSIDGSQDGTREMVERLAVPYALRAIWRPHGGRAAACNAGLYAAKGELVVLLDDDMEPVPEFLAAHMRAHSDGYDSAVLGAVPVRLDRQSRPVVRYVGTKFNRHLATLAQPGYRMRLRDFYSGNCSMRRATVLRVGLFDEAFTVYGNEDLELSVRLARAGVRLSYAPAAAAYQRYTKDFDGLASDTINKGRTAVLLATKHPTTLAELKLSGYDDEFPRWRYARTLLLEVSDRWSRLPWVITRCVQLLEFVRTAWLDVIYVLVLDYLYWLGARSALRDQPIAREVFGSAEPGADAQA